MNWGHFRSQLPVISYIITIPFQVYHYLEYMSLKLHIYRVRLGQHIPVKVSQFQRRKKLYEFYWVRILLFSITVILTDFRLRDLGCPRDSKSSNRKWHPIAVLTFSFSNYILKELRSEFWALAENLEFSKMPF